MDTMSIRVAIVEDEGGLREAYRTMLNAVDGLTCTGAFPSVAEALPALQGEAAAADVLLLDIELPGIPGDQAIALFRQACPALRIVMLTVFADRDRLFSSLCNGAHGYLLKTTPPAQLLDAIRAARDGGSPFSPEIARHIVERFQKGGPPPPEVSLTAQEQRLLALLAEGYSYQSAAARMNVSVNTIRNYIRSIYEKLHVHTKSEAVSKALRHGLIG